MEENREINVSETTEQVVRPSKWRQLFSGDRPLWIIIAILMLFSVLVVYSSTAKMTYKGASLDGTNSYLFKQLAFWAVALCCIIIFHKMNYQFYFKLVNFVYWLTLFATIYAMFFGKSINGANRWIPIPLINFDLQPSEFLKVATILMLAYHLSPQKIQKNIESLQLLPTLKFWTWHKNWAKVRGVLWQSKAIIGPIFLSCVVIIPSHTSSAMIVFITCCAMLIIGRVRLKEVTKLVSITVIAGAIFLFGLNLGRADTAQGRFSPWMETWTQDQSGKPIEELSDTQRSMMAIYNGGIMGQGAGESAMRVELIHPESDYAFALFVEEWGLIAATILLLLYIWIFYRGRHIFKQCTMVFSGFVAVGLAMLISVQALIHIAVSVNLLPETGQSLPLISHGGSSLLANAIALGLILRVSRQMEEKSLS